MLLCCIDDRLYLVEADESDGDPLCGRRILVLSLQGDTLHTFLLPYEGHFIEEMRHFNGKLLVSYYAGSARNEWVTQDGIVDEDGSPNGGVLVPLVGVITLRGL